MFVMRFMDGTPVNEAYSNMLTGLVSGAAEAGDIFSENDLEAYAEAHALNQSQAANQIAA